ncbi:TetR/AcrR family transcriptional regulator [Kibdelosporangium aridum]|nr:TetR/AcrR family transcriptional regulator [Kibdelosporangium aridum]
MRTSAQAGGRPRDSRVDHAIQTTVRELLAEVGYASLTMDLVAARAGIGKAAIYRRHASKAEMVFSAVVHGMDLQPVADTGSLRTDLRGTVIDVLGRVSEPSVRAGTPTFLAELAVNKEMSARFQSTLVARETACVETVLDRAVARGEIRRKPDPAVVHATILGTVTAWLHMLQRDDYADLPDQLADILTNGLTGS